MNAVVEKMEAPAEVVRSPQADQMLALVERVLLTPDLPLERISAVMDLRDREEAKEAERAFNRDFADAMADMPDIPKSGYNSHLKRHYSTLDDLIRTARPVLTRHGMHLNWDTGESEDGRLWAIAYVRHRLGHMIKSSPRHGTRDSGKSMNALQGGGSTETYLKRYTGFSVLGLSSGEEKDNDGATPDPCISPEQVSQVRNTLEKIDLGEGVILDAERIQSLEDMPAAKFEHVMKQLKITAEKRGVEL